MPLMGVGGLGLGLDMGGSMNKGGEMLEKSRVRQLEVMNVSAIYDMAYRIISHRIIS